MGHEWFTVPATDVPAAHYFGGLVNTAMFHNRSNVATAVVWIDFEDGTAKLIYAGETFVLEASDTSSQQDTGKIFGRGYMIRGDGIQTIAMEVTWTCKAPINDREPVTV
jgi:hypothetical protein